MSPTTIYLVMSTRDGQTYHPEVWRRTEPAAEQWARDREGQLPHARCRIVEFRGAEIASTPTEMAMGRKGR